MKIDMEYLDHVLKWKSMRWIIQIIMINIYDLQTTMKYGGKHYGKKAKAKIHR